METLEKRLKSLKKYRKDLQKISINLSTSADKTCRVRYGKRFILVDAPNREWGNIFADEFKSVIQRQIEKIDTITTTLQNHCEQLTMGLFKGEVNGSNEGSCGEEKGYVPDAVGQIKGSV